MSKDFGSLEKQVQRLNENLEKVIKDNRFFIYSTKPSRFVLLNFLSGILRSLGSTIGTLVVLGVGGYLAARVLGKMDFTGAIADWLQQIVNRSTQGLPGPR